jgi:hypothetical protein
MCLPLYPWGNGPQYPLDRRLGGPQNQPGWWRRENSWPYQDSNSDSSVVQPVVSHYTDYAIAAPSHSKGVKIKGHMPEQGEMNEVRSHQWWICFPRIYEEVLKNSVLRFVAEFEFRFTYSYILLKITIGVEVLYVVLIYTNSVSLIIGWCSSCSFGFRGWWCRLQRHSIPTGPSLTAGSMYYSFISSPYHFCKACLT